MSSSSNATPGDVIVNVFGRTDVGRTREHNEDAFVVADLTANNATLQPEVRTHTAGAKGTLFMVADGMGGAAAGEIASEMAVKVVLSDLQAHWIESSQTSGEAFVRAIKSATRAANDQINSFAGKHPEFRGMGTTATVAGLLGDTLYIAQVGDSRAYIVRDSVARQITKDQSLMQKLIEAGEITEEEAELSERRNIILQALGPEPNVKIDLTHQQIRRGDVLVLCSDGLSGQVSKEEIAKIVGSESDLTSACKALIDLANAKGGPDNITVIVARFEGPGLREADSTDEVAHRVFPLPDSGQVFSAPYSGYVDGFTPTEEMPALDDAGMRRGYSSEELRAASEAQTRRTSPIPAQTPVVSEARRTAGRRIAIALLVVLVLGAAWYLYHTATKP